MVLNNVATVVVMRPCTAIINNLQNIDQRSKYVVTDTSRIREALQGKPGARMSLSLPQFRKRMSDFQCVRITIWAESRNDSGKGSIENSSSANVLLDHASVLLLIALAASWLWCDGLVKSVGHFEAVVDAATTLGRHLSTMPSNDDVIKSAI